MFANFAHLLAIASVALVGINVNAAPAANVANLEARDAQVDGHLFVCTDSDFTGICANVAFNIATCINFESPFQDSISSFGPDAGFLCITYTDSNCRGSTYQATSPGFTSFRRASTMRLPPSSASTSREVVNRCFGRWNEDIIL